MWTVRRSFDAMIKVQNRLLARTQKALHDQALNALVAIGSLVDLLGWVSKSDQKRIFPKFTKLSVAGNGQRERVDGERSSC